MTGKFPAAALAAALLWTCHAHGNIGETAAEIDARYGAAREKPANETSGVLTRLYVSGGLGISVKFMDGKSQSEIYVKEDHSDFSSAEIAALLESNRLGSDWVSLYKSPDVERWELRSKTAAAFYYASRRMLMISTVEFMRSGNKIKLIDDGVDKPGKD